MKKICLLLIIIMCFSIKAYSKPLTVRYFQTDHRYDYRTELLKLVLESTAGSDGPFSLEPVKTDMTQGRALVYLEEGKNVDIASLATNAGREKRFLVVRIPILRGILGYRVFIIHKENLKKFSEIETLEQLKTNFKAGFGLHWADMKILKHNNIPVEGVSEYKSLFRMLSSRRFDYFPRGINEAWKEISEMGSKYPNLTVEPNIAVYYPYPVYFFVNKQNLKLADRIERGLKRVTKDGSFEKLFLKYHDAVIRQADLKNRKMFVLKNPVPTK
ncbi:MAG: amino acid ABC transporter substrate-binding protein [Desulfobacteraceae bacterium]|nr:amino acid ABC transporter substrate-binding protein [Desulfobacteraceae bacterium]